jgi:hypothetical protein
MQKLQDYPTPSPLSQTKNNPKEKTNLAPLKGLHHINVHGYNPKTKIIQCGWPPINIPTQQTKHCQS